MKRRVYSRSVTVLVVLAMAAGILASVANSADAAKVNNDIGLGSAAALNQPNCDKTTGRWKIQFYATGPCVRPFAKGENNGGATAQGVTKDSVMIVALIPPAAGDLSAQNGGIKNQATGANGRSENALYDDEALLSHFYNTWGRTFKYEFVTSTGSDEASQRADAIAVLAKKPFGVIDLASLAPAGLNGGGQFFDTAIAQAKVPANPIPLTIAQTYQPYEAITAEFVAKNASTGNAIYAGDALKSTKRKIGVIYPEGSLGVDPNDLLKPLAKAGVKVDAANVLAFTVPTDSTQLLTQVQSQAPTIIAKLKDAGVTTIVHLGIGVNQTTPFPAAATANDYFPEWVEAGNGYIDLDFFARNFDTKQWSHAFGPVWFTPSVNGGVPDTNTAWFQWYWGKTQGTHSPGVLALIRRIYDGVALAGPTLTTASYNAGLQKFPPVGGAYSGMITNLEASFITPALTQRIGTAIGWWNPNVSGNSNQVPITGQGKYMYLDGGKRYAIGKYPKNVKLFDPTNSIAFLDALPASDVVGPYTCDKCPSTGGGEQPSSSAS